MTGEQKDIAVQMATEGKSIVFISKELGLEWSEVSECLRSAGVHAFIGAKQKITYRLNRLKRENDPDKREQLVNEVNDLINYIYYSGKDMGRVIDRARKALGSQGAKLAE